MHVEVFELVEVGDEFLVGQQFLAVANQVFVEVGYLLPEVLLDYKHLLLRVLL